MKKLTGFILLICCITMLCCPCLAETSPPNFDVALTTDSVKVDEEVYLLVNLEDNVGFSATQFCITYDAGKLTLEDATLGELIPSDAINSINTDIIGEINFSVITLQEITESGTLLVSKFKAKETGTAKLDFKLLAYADGNGTSLNSTDNDAELTITSGSTGGALISPSGGGSGGGGKAEETEKPTEPPTEPEDENKPAFTDVAKTHWAYTQINKVCELGLFSGTAKDTFSPGTPMTRAMFVTVLHRYAGTPKSEKADFTDIEDSWYTDAVSWAAESGIVSGTGDNKFSPDAYITRGEISSILARYKNGTSKDINSINNFKDANEIPEWGKDAIAWAVENGLVMGREGGIVAFSDNATRAEAAVIFTRFLNIQ